MLETQVNPWVGKIPGGGNGNPLQYSCLGNPRTEEPGGLHSPWGRKESGTTEAIEHACTQLQRRPPPSRRSAGWRQRTSLLSINPWFLSWLLSKINSSTLTKEKPAHITVHHLTPPVHPPEAVSSYLISSSLSHCNIQYNIYIFPGRDSYFISITKHLQFELNL